MWHIGGKREMRKEVWWEELKKRRPERTLNDSVILKYRVFKEG
jgi:hypothetical protein